MSRHLDQRKSSSCHMGRVSLLLLSFCQRLLECHPSFKQMKCVISFEIDINAILAVCENEIRILNVQNPTAFNEKMIGIITYLELRKDRIVFAHY